MKKNRYEFIYGLFFILIFSSCDEYQNCIKTVELNIYPSSGSFVIDTLYTRYGYRTMYKAISKDRKDTLEIFDYNSLPKTPQKGDSIVKILNEPYYTLYSKDSFFVMGADCRIRRTVTFNSGLMEDVQINQIEEVDE